MNEQVMQAIEEELAYQHTRWAEVDRINNVGDFLLYMRRELDEAADRQHYVSPLDCDGARDQVRKVVAMGIIVMEIHGIVRRSKP